MREMMGLWSGVDKITFVGCGVMVFARDIARNSTDLFQQPFSEPVWKYLINNTGDFENALAVSIMADFSVKYLFSETPLNLRRRYAMATGALAVIIAETIKMPVLSWVTDKDDIPAGLIGVACYLGISLWQYRNTKAQKSI